PALDQAPDRLRACRVGEGRQLVEVPFVDPGSAPDEDGALVGDRTPRRRDRRLEHPVGRSHRRCGSCVRHQLIDDPASRSRSLRRILSSVASLRSPITRPHGIAYSPAGNERGRVPGTTIAPSGTRARCSTGSGPRGSITGVLPVSTTPAPRTAPRPTCTPSTTMHREPMKASSSITTGTAWSGSRIPPIPTPPDRWTFAPICAQDPTVAQVSTIVPAPTYAPMFT